MTQANNRPVRIGAVSYLNSKPLIEGLGELLPQAELVLDVPSRLADALAARSLDVALIPSVEYLRDPGLEIISDACVATHGPVLSVKLYSRVPAGEIRSLSLDEGSRTSAALVRILLSERYGIEPELQPLPLGSTVETSTTDAVLIIGDRAMHPPAEEFETTWDLGEEWISWTGLPFVFAMWAAPAGTVSDQVEHALSQARDQGLEKLDAIARAEAPLLDISDDAAIGYLTKNLYYRLGSAEKNGLKLFQKLAADMDLIPSLSSTEIPIS